MHPRAVEMGMENPLTYIGIFTCAYILFKLVVHIYTYLRPSSLPKYLHSKESYALVTGSTDGIGRGFVYELCERGFNIVLHGRNPQKLARIEDQLKKEFPQRKFRTLLFDASQSTESLDRLIQPLQDIEITVLVNNVGGGQARSMFLSVQDHTREEIDRTININARFMAQLTRLMLPILKRNSPSLVMNISSVAALGLPLVCVYGATKGFVETFSKGLKMEMMAGGHQVDVMSVRVGSVQSASHDVPTSFFVPTARPMARAALARVGCGSVSVLAYWPHRIQCVLFDYFPEKLVQLILINGVNTREAEDKKKGQAQ
ncbi:hypothetical protein AJ80_02702 [Polytolypa hystricis UAMH7299]|uniref:Uncharacterized protein n=1 Tax=Polytolypa hystricis (strain UAMH7299) TaxID=1447883 RepID=A0A2B7YNQ6_POLH7|nr:hypothetical protein AJ80_02702 [Polytolypa hystricis UAMH7299]